MCSLQQVMCEVVLAGNLVSSRTWHDNAPLMREFLAMIKANLKN